MTQGAKNVSRPLDPSAAATGPGSPAGLTAAEAAGLGTEEGASVEDRMAAQESRPTLPEETADGLDDTDEEIRHQAEDMPLDTPGRLR